MKPALTLLLALGLAACSFTPPKPPSYEDAPRVPINKPVTLTPASPS